MSAHHVLLEDDLLERCLSALERLAPTAKTLILAVSGGADSVALLRLMALSKFEIHVAHFDHSLRLESRQDALFVERLAAELGLPFYSERADVARIALDKGWNLEDAARRLRYAFLTRTARQVGADAVLSAHTLDDQVETVLMQLLRGAAYLKGMPEKQGHVLRPLLSTAKSDLLAYLADIQQPFREDTSNSDIRRTRAWLRHTVVPQLKVRYPSLPLTLSRLADLQSAQADHFSKAAQPFLPPPVSVAHLLKEDVAVQREVLAQVLSADLTHIEAVRAALSSAEPQRVSLPKDRLARVAYGELAIVQQMEKVEARAFQPQDVPKLEPPLNLEKLRHIQDLVWRSRLPGDKIKLASGTKKLSELLIDLKIPREERDSIALIASGSRVLWLEGLAADADLALPATDPDESWMRLALKQAERAAELGELPIGAVVVRDDEVIASAHNETEKTKDPSAHAEVLGLRRSAQVLGNWRLAGCTLYVTLEPCPMCFGAALQAHLPRLVYGATNEREGALESVGNLAQLGWKRVPEVRGGVLAHEAAAHLGSFFKQRRNA